MFRLADVVASLRGGCSDSRRGRGLVLSDDYDRGLRDPTGPLTQGRGPELIREDNRSRITVEKQHGSRIAVLEHETALLGAHGAIGTLVRDEELVDLKNIVEEHCSLKSLPRATSSFALHLDWQSYSSNSCILYQKCNLIRQSVN